MLSIASPLLNSIRVEKQESWKYVLNLTEGWSEGLISKSIITMTFMSRLRCLLTEKTC